MCPRCQHLLYPSNTENSYRTASGTSFSAPLVAGAAVILLVNPEWTNMQVREALLMTASKAIHRIIHMAMVLLTRG